MKLGSHNMKQAFLQSLLLLALLAPARVRAVAPSFADFDRRATAGEKLNVVFFGASLTWGANATDPNLTSYRGVIARKLEAEYPGARFHFWDAAIGGTGSQLGAFRLERDVLRRQPDLVFLDFTANDGIGSDTPESLASYEAIVRRVVAEAHAPVVQVIFPFMWDVQSGKLAEMKRRIAHLKIAAAYHTAAGDAVELAQRRMTEGKTTIAQLWPVDGVHPGDVGYELFADAAWGAFQLAVKEKRICAAPVKMLHAGTYMKTARVRISTLGALPAGWATGRPNVVAAYFDFLMSRWLDDEVIATNRRKVDGKDALQPVEPLRFRFRGSMVMFFGEGTEKSGRFRAFVDGKLVERAEPDGKPPLKEFDAASLAKIIRGNGHFAQVIAEGLDPALEHTLVIEPVFVHDKEQELRLESICVAGGEAKLSKEPN